MPIVLMGGLLLVAIALWIYLWASAQCITITCTPAGFTVCTGRRFRNSTCATYAWADVTGTRYYERVEDGAEGAGRSGYFRVDTTRGVAFVRGIGTRDGALIEVFNDHTPHLPYIWRKRRKGETTRARARDEIVANLRAQGIEPTTAEGLGAERLLQRLYGHSMDTMEYIKLDRAARL